MGEGEENKLNKIKTLNKLRLDKSVENKLNKLKILKKLRGEKEKRINLD